MLNRVKQKAKLSYYNDKFVEYKNNAHKLWQVVNQIIGKHKNKKSIIDYLTIQGVKYYNEIDINNAFGKYFACIGKKLAHQIDKPDKDAMYYLQKIPKIERSLFITQTNKIEIQKSDINLI